MTKTLFNNIAYIRHLELKFWVFCNYRNLLQLTKFHYNLVTFHWNMGI